MNIIDDAPGQTGCSVKEILTLGEEFGGVKLLGEVSIPERARIASQLADAFSRKRDRFFEGIGTRMVRARKE